MTAVLLEHALVEQGAPTAVRRRRRQLVDHHALVVGRGVPAGNGRSDAGWLDPRDLDLAAFRAAVVALQGLGSPVKLENSAVDLRFCRHRPLLAVQ